MSNKFTINQLYEIADMITIDGVSSVLKKSDIKQNDLNDLLYALIRKQAIERNKLRKKKINILIDLYVDDNNSVTNTISDLKEYLEIEENVEKVKAKILNKKEAQDPTLFDILLQDLRDYIDTYDDMKTIDEVLRSMK